jgi:hypothetical protein
MRTFDNQHGKLSTLLIGIILCAALFSLFNTYGYFFRAGFGHSYRELRQADISSEEATEIAYRDGRLCGVFMALNTVSLALLVFVTIGLSLKATVPKVKRRLLFLFPIIVVAGIISLTIGLSFWAYNLEYPDSLMVSAFQYIVLSLFLWLIIGIASIRNRKAVSINRDAASSYRAKAQQDTLFEEFCQTCTHYESNDGVCRRLHRSVIEYPTTLHKQCKGKYHESAPLKISEDFLE